MQRNILFNLKILLAIFAINIVLVGCSSISEFSQYAYQQAVDLKVESLDLIGNADQPFEDYTDDVYALKLELKKAMEFAKGRKDNEISTKQWEILTDENRNLLGGFLKRWEDEDTLSKMFIDEAKQIISDAFDTIIGLESGKIKPSEIQ
jgi:PBP1b-binding outer membrane lipoprotein LpoB